MGKNQPMSAVDRSLYGFLMAATVIATIFILAMFFPSNAKRSHHEAWYQERWCETQKGIMEYRLPDAARIDCLTDTHAIEFDFAAKWAEAIGQALYYAGQTGRKPGIVLIINGNDRDRAYIDRLERTIKTASLDIDVWYMHVHK
jgi:hypothetical protein